MPTVLRKEGFSFRMYFDDHLPPHIHAIKGSGEIKISLGDQQTEPKVLAIYDMNIQEVKRALMIVFEHQTEFLKRWIDIYG